MQAKAENGNGSYSLPDETGHFGPYGGVFVAETLMEPLAELRAAYERYIQDKAFLEELDEDLQHYVGRPSPLYYAARWSQELNGARIYLKREDLNHTGAHKVNNTVGQALLAQRMGKTRIIEELAPKVLSLQCREGLQTTPYYPVIQSFRTTGRFFS